MTNNQSNIDLLKNSRFVWMAGTPETSRVSEEKEDGNVSWDEALKAVDFKNSAKKLCDAGEQHICALVEESDINKTVKLKTFIDELGEKFLNKIPERKYKFAKNSVKRLQLLQEVADMETIMERFKEAESYEIKPYRRGRNPAMIIFNYPPDEENPEGTMEEYPLEMSWLEKRKSIGQGLRAIRKGVRKREKGQRRKEDLIAWENYLRTPEGVHSELKNMKTHLPDDLLEKLSTPISKIIKIRSNAKVGYEDAKKADLAEEELEKVLEDYISLNSFPEDMDYKQLGDILNIIEEFQLD